MKNCIKCGFEIKDGMTTCPGCGAALGSKSRREEYAGSIIRCPACGQELSSFDGVCPACGHEINVEKVSQSFKKFVNGLSSFEGDPSSGGENGFVSRWDSWNTKSKVFWVALNVCLFLIPMAIVFLIPLISGRSSLNLTDSEKKKAVYIENYAFSNDKATTIEALVFIDAKVARLACDADDANSLFWASIWKSKAEHVFDKSELVIPNDKTASRTFNDIQNNYQTIKSLVTRKSLLKFVSVALVSLVLIIFTTAFINPTISNFTNDLSSAKKAADEVSAQKKKEQHETQYSWPDYGLWRDLPKPASSYGSVVKDGSDFVSIEVYKVSQETFNSYAEECRARGYDQNYSKESERFRAKNWLDRYITVSYLPTEEMMTISLEKKGWL